MTDAIIQATRSNAVRNNYTGAWRPAQTLADLLENHATPQQIQAALNALETAQPDAVLRNLYHGDIIRAADLALTAEPHRQVA